MEILFFNSSKYKVGVYGKDHDSDKCMMISNQIVSAQKTSVHMGIILTDKPVMVHATQL